MVRKLAIGQRTALKPINIPGVHILLLLSPCYYVHEFFESRAFERVVIEYAQLYELVFPYYKGEVLS